MITINKPKNRKDITAGSLVTILNMSQLVYLVTGRTNDDMVTLFSLYNIDKDREFVTNGIRAVPVNEVILWEGQITIEN